MKKEVPVQIIKILSEINFKSQITRKSLFVYNINGLRNHNTIRDLSFLNKNLFAAQTQFWRHAVIVNLSASTLVIILNWKLAKAFCRKLPISSTPRIFEIQFITLF